VKYKCLNCGSEDVKFLYALLDSKQALTLCADCAEELRGFMALADGEDGGYDEL
jgi:predicted nucleic acid-binding Zn ribbon protein